MSDYDQVVEQLRAANAYILNLGGTVPAPPMPTPPRVVDVPAVTGNGVVGSTLTCTMGNWTGEPTSYAYQWKSDGTTELGTGDTYVAVEGDTGHSVSCVVTATNAAGSMVAPPSNAVAIVAAAATQARHMPAPEHHRNTTRK
jgi:hypothetical protein